MPYSRPASAKRPPATRSSGKVRAEGFFVEIVERGALLFGVIGNVPGLQLGSRGAFDGAAEFEQLRVFGAETGFGSGFEVFEKSQGPGAVVGHAVFEYQVGEIAEAENAGLGAAQLQNAGHNGPVVALRLGGADGKGLVELAAHGGIVQVSHDRKIVGRLQGEAPAIEVFAGGAFARRGDGGSGQPGQIRLIGENAFEGVGGIEHVLAEFGGDGGELDVDLLELLLADRVEVGAGPAEPFDGLDQVAAAFSGKGGAFGSLRISLDRLPEPGMEGDSGTERADLRLDGVPRGAQLRVGGHGFEMANHAHGEIERLGERVERPQSVVPGALAVGRGDGFEARAGVAEQAGRSRFHAGGADAIEGNAEADLEKRIGVGGAHLPDRIRRGGLDAGGHPERPLERVVRPP